MFEPMEEVTTDAVKNFAAACPMPITDHREIVLGHGSGGKLSQRLLEQLILPAFTNDLLTPLHDGAIINQVGSRMAFSTDSHVVSPIFFPGGDIGKLAVHGTVNDLAMCGARPLHLSAGLIMEEGLPMEQLWQVLQSMREAADGAGVKIVTGDTKVVERGKADKIFVSTSGIGVIADGIDIRPTRARPGDHVLLSGSIAAHGIAIMSVREGLDFESPIVSDTAALNGLVAQLLDAAGEGIHVLRDPTRGGLASALNEIAGAAGHGIHLNERAIPIAEAVRGACEILGLDPLYVANEGVLVAIVAAEVADAVLAAMQAHPHGTAAVDIGAVVTDHPGMVTMTTSIGGSRVVDMLSGEQLPRIC